MTSIVTFLFIFCLFGFGVFEGNSLTVGRALYQEKKKQPCLNIPSIGRNPLTGTCSKWSSCIVLSPCYFIPWMDWWQGRWGHGPVPPSHHGMLTSLSSQKPWGDLQECCVGRRGGSWSTLSQEMVPMLLGLAASAHLCLGEALLLPVNIWELLRPHFYARPRAACWEMLTGLSMTTVGPWPHDGPTLTLTLLSLTSPRKSSWPAVKLSTSSSHLSNFVFTQMWTSSTFFFSMLFQFSSGSWMHMTDPTVNVSLFHETLCDKGTNPPKQTDGDSA